jgi:hypothetical protein
MYPKNILVSLNRGLANKMQISYAKNNFIDNYLLISPWIEKTKT